MLKKIKTFSDLVSLAGSYAKIAVVCDVSEAAVRNWEVTRIPHKHWEAIMQEWRLSAQELHDINVGIFKSNSK
jgi:hypothetical protein